MCNYPEYVQNISSIPPLGNREENRRFCLSIDIDVVDEGTEVNNNETISVIMMNPSRATDERSDHSVNKIIEYVNINKLSNSDLNNVKRIYILNLYSSYETHSENLSLYSNEIENDNYIVEKVKKSKFVILAYGKPKKLRGDDLISYKQRISRVIQIIDNLGISKKHIGPLTNDGFPRHACYIGYDYRLQDYS